MAARPKFGPSASLQLILESTFYEIAPAIDIPLLDPSITVKQLVFPKQWLPRINRFLRRHAVVIGLAYVAGLVCRSLSVAVPAHVAQCTALATLPLQLPAVLNIVFQFRVGFLKYLLRTYDYWYFFVMNAIWAACLARYLRDWRVAIVPFMWIDVQNATLLDAFLQEFRPVVSATWVWCAFLVGVIGVVSLDLVDAVDGSDEVFVTPHRTITVKEMLLNALATVIVLIGRIVYRKRAALRSQRKLATSTVTSVQSITLTWPLMLRERATMSAHGWPPRPREISHTSKLQLHVTLRSKPIQASDVVLPRALAHLRRPTVFRWVVRFVGVVGLLATPAVFCLDPESTWRRSLAAAAVLSTAAYAGMVVCYYQRRLFALLVVSFDFAFISLQLTIVHLCVADAYQWDAAPTLGVASSWLWLHMVLTIDALTPAMRRALGFCSWFQVPVLVLTQAAVVVLWLELSFWDSQGLRNRCFLRLPIGEHELKLHVVPCLLSRLLTVALWAARILYRIAIQRSDHELLTIRSHVEFDALKQQRQRATFRINPTPPS